MVQCIQASKSSLKLFQHPHCVGRREDVGKNLDNWVSLLPPPVRDKCIGRILPFKISPGANLLVVDVTCGWKLLLNNECPAKFAGIFAIFEIWGVLVLVTNMILGWMSIGCIWTSCCDGNPHSCASMIVDKTSPQIDARLRKFDCFAS